ncbi:MAG TPA: hypothetical protein VGR66_01720 [Candidatus Eisenbacteria bacterium]|nr:hypothetical protein [Candidatus Eisenbacteria bacterium]
MRGRTTARHAALVLAALACLVMGVGKARADKKPLPESNLALLDHAITATARTLVKRAPISSGAKIALEKMPEGSMHPVAQRAMLGALTDQRIEVTEVDAPAPGIHAPSSAAPSAAMPDSIAKGTIEQQFAWRREHKSDPVIDSTPSEGTAALTEQGDLPLLVISLDESRVDYPRLFRSGLFGGMHVERRAIVTLSAKLLRPDTRAVYWVGQADTSLADYVRKSEVPLLEDAAVPETKGTVPQQSWQKMVEPVLVVGLIIGLVSLFYTNRP